MGALQGGFQEAAPLWGWRTGHRGVFQPEGAGAYGGREGPGGPPDGKGLCFPHSLLLEHLLRSWERIPKKVSWEDMAG